MGLALYTFAYTFAYFATDLVEISVCVNQVPQVLVLYALAYMAGMEILVCLTQVYHAFFLLYVLVHHVLLQMAYHILLYPVLLSPILAGFHLALKIEL